ncbi:MAG: SusC/RagA family TonB-linked outer membrane protein [Sanguibacteroides justesenii]|nr:SusC/RagA family TonB-linked outer membrane protein [Sanguibacteroides justesenii]
MKKKQNFYCFHGKKNLLKIMRLLFVLMTMTSMTISASGFSQQQRVTLDVKNVGAMELFKEIQRGTSLYFVYNNADLSAYDKISVSARDENVDILLKRVFPNLDFLFEGNVIIVKPTASIDERKDIKKFAIKGKVVDDKNQPLPGVTIRVDSTTVGCSTDEKGLFSLVLPMETGRLIFSFIGFKQEVRKFKAGDELLVKMKEDVSDLDEVTVIAYGERNKRELIGSVSSVKAKDLEEIPSASLTNLLQGHMAGVEVSNISGAPGGGGTRVIVRGYNSLMNGTTSGEPLYVVDGVPIHSFTSPVTGTNTLAEIDPSTIESVEVLKDAASAAIYGSRASNGVILITTKKGKVGRGDFQANVSYSYSVLPETPEQIIGNGERRWWIATARNERIAGNYGNPMTGDDWQLPTSYYEAYAHRAGTYDYFWGNGYSLQSDGYGYHPQLQDSLNPFYNNATNWWKQVFRHGKIINANLQSSGGNERVTYLVGGGWYQEKGIMYGSEFKRANLITNINMKPRKNLSLDARLYLSYSDRSRGSGSSGFGDGKAIERLTADPKQTSSLLPADGEVKDRLLQLLNSKVDKAYSYNIRSSLNLGYEFIRGLKLTASISANYTEARSNTFSPSYLDQQNNLSKSIGQMEGNMILQNEELLSYKFNIKERHNFDLLFGFSYIRTSKNSMYGSGEGSPSDKIHYVLSGFNTTYTKAGEIVSLQKYNSNFEEKIQVSGFGRIAYNFRQKYLTEVTLRRDGSSVFGEDVRWATFPSVAVGWAFSEEKFMDRLWWLSYGKIRASWGTSGQEFAEPYLAHGTYVIGDKFLGGVGMDPATIFNKSLTWEESDQYDIGLDVDLFDYRLKFKLDYYYKYSKSVLWNAPLPGSVYYFSSAWQNALEVSNEGLELEMVADILRETSVSWRARFNISRNWNRFEKSYSGLDVPGSSNPYVIGRSLFGFYVYKNLGMIQNAEDVPSYFDQNMYENSLYAGHYSTPYREGMYQLADLNGDGRIDADNDRYYAASTLPLASGGFANEIAWKNFDLNVLFTFSFGRKMINGLKKGGLASDHQFGPVFRDYRGSTFWQQSGDQTDYPRIEAAYSGYTGQFDGYTDKDIETVGFVRLKQLTLGYNVPQSIMKKIGLESGRVFFTGENLFLITNYSGVDPESVDPTSGIDNFNNYPLARKLTLGLTLKF